ncbi:chemotaxis protein CheA [Halobacterium sp. KA-4]|uniref:chemotaxis protein CheA n=1 Tax=Halobacterium sp. KA-4 TaxID=2896367 RepID=UPI001E38FBCB|nr:chemotaxis protein CheA [Halobacterium sp. KA-4]MCD2200445.1 chemotaxis protein CheA [Halobacterium sp. KA-4]
MDDHLDAFVREGNHHLTALNEVLVELGEDPDSEEAVAEFFRRIHTLKGMFSAMGFDAASDLAHAIEDLVAEIQQDDLAVTQDRRSRLAEGVAELAECLVEIEASGIIQRDVSATITALRADLDASDAGVEAAVSDGSAGVSGDPFGIVDRGVVERVDGHVFHIRVEIGESPFRGVDGMLVLEAATDAFDVLGTRPSQDAITAGEYETEFDLVVASKNADIEATVQAFPKLADATITELDPADTTDTETPTDLKDSPLEAISREGAETGDANGVADAVGEAVMAASDTAVQSVTVDADSLEELSELVDRLFLTQRQRENEYSGQQGGSVGDLGVIAGRLQETVLDMRLRPVETITAEFSRLANGLAEDQGKDIEFVVTGEDVVLDYTRLAALRGPLLHLLRNAIDHGIESPEERQANGKAPAGTVVLAAKRDRDHVTIEVRDDGCGLDHEQLRETAINKGIKTQADIEELSDAEVAELIFEPGFSTTDSVTDLSGRGVGLDAVQETISDLDGSVSVSSEPGAGTTVTMTFPGAVAIQDVVFLECGGREYGIPSEDVVEVSQLRSVETIDSENVLSDGKTDYSLVWLDDALNVTNGTREDNGMLVYIHSGDHQIAVHCDDIRRQQEVLLKPFEKEVSNDSVFSGVALPTDGDVDPMLDVAVLDS